MQYLLLINHDPNAWPDCSEEYMEGITDQHRRLQELSKSKGEFVAAQRLSGADTATTVRKQNDELVMTDGPYTESKEVLVGYYLVECENLDDALEYARMIPVPEGGGVEVRPVFYNVPAD